MKTMDLFHEVPCLTEHSPMKGVELQRKWFKSADRRIIGQYLQKFIDYNSAAFEFLGVRPSLLGTDQNIKLVFQTSGFIGVVPLRASDTGKQIGDFVVTPRFTGQDRFEEYIEILDLLGKEISPQFMPSLPLVSGRNFRPPLYLEAVKFIALLEKLVQHPWRKFDNVEKIENQPLGQVNWNKYIEQEHKTEARLKFPVRKNLLSETHREYAEIRYVFDICRHELQSPNTPLKVKTSLVSRLKFLEEKLYPHKPLRTRSLTIGSSDSLVVRECKTAANKILNYQLVDSTAWRVDFADVFEKWVQHVFRETAKITGGKLSANLKLHSRASVYYPWQLKHLEADAVYQKENTLVFIDAKYKANLYNKNRPSESLNESHRHDLHQILAYSSFSETPMKYGFLCYPSNAVQVDKIAYINPTNAVTNTIFIFGIPLNRHSINEAKLRLSQVLNDIE